jgi:hypothetical protein
MLSGPGIIYYMEDHALWTKGYLHPRLWHLLTRHYQHQDHTPHMIIANIHDKMPQAAISLAVRAANIICDMPGNKPDADNAFRPRSIYEYLLSAHITSDQLAAIQEQIVRHDGVIALKQAD